MKQYLVLVLFLGCFFLTGCFSQSQMRFENNTTRENWAQEIETDPMRWARGTDAWFLSGDAHATTSPVYYTTTPVSVMKVEASHFTRIKTNGCFQVQIFGTDGKDSVYVYGSNAAVRAIAISVKGDTLSLTQMAKVPFMETVIIRIGVHRLNCLTQLGRGTVEGIRLRGDLAVSSLGSGNVYLAGHMNLRSVQNFGSGCINVFGADTPELDIRTGGTGTTNVSGNVGIRSIMHSGSNNINVIGANSNQLKIYADGNGKIGINGIVNLCVVKARGNTRIYVCKVNSGNLHAYAYDNARIGLKGVTQNFYLDAYKNTCVSARGLCADVAYVRAFDNAHVNVSAWRKIFSSASDTSSVYYFGPRESLTKFINDNGIIVSVGPCAGYCPLPQRTTVSYPRMLVGAG